MILRRPNAFIIKHLKLIHTIILVCLAYILFKTSDLSNTYQEVVRVKSIIGKDHASRLFGPYLFLSLVIGLIFTIIIFILLVKKQKKKQSIFYGVLIILFLATLIFDVMSFNNIKIMQARDVSAQVYFAYNDISKILFYLQSVFVFIVLFKAIGFDIKTLSFGKVSGIDLTEADSEEVEFNLEIDGNELRTKRRKLIREFRYKYRENKKTINLVVISLILLIAITTIFLLDSKKEIYYSFGDELHTQTYSVIIENAYLTNTDFKGNRISDKNMYIVLLLKLRNDLESELKFNYSRIPIKINDETYYVSQKSLEYFSDYGEPYKEQNLTKDYVDYYLVYELPYETANREIDVLVSNYFDYEKNEYDYYKVKGFYNLDNQLKQNVYEVNLTEKMEINSFGIKSDVIIEEFEFSNKFKLTYVENINNKDYEKVEYLVPTTSDNDDKTILKLVYKSELENFASLLSKYGTIEYEIDGLKKEAKIYAFLDAKVKEPNTHYIQVSKDVLTGQNRSIRIKIRSDIYIYHLDKESL